jgi:putative endonuclease
VPAITGGEGRAATMRDMRTSMQRAGDDAEARVATQLAASGWSILGRNVRIGRGELDLVAVDPGPPPCLVIVEVRRRSSRGYGLPEETLDWRKRAHLRAAIGRLRQSEWAAEVALPALHLRVDLVAVEPPSTGEDVLQIRHHRGIGL